MKTRKTFQTLALLSILALAASCGGYASGIDPKLDHQQDAVSECGGFGTYEQALQVSAEDYCAAERLHWTYDPASATLRLLDARVLLNCCGDHSMTLSVIDGVYEAYELDEPEDGWGRCLCMCVFDFSVEASGVPEDLITLRLLREVTDDGQGVQVVLEDTQIDLGQGSGVIVIDDRPEEVWCGQEY
ncbi:MAG: hypothetical protein JXR96_03965 [Deltaproteobacteria bacterium]|nr:hypothetical protein [Deltaproteobacteria bacterium]